VETLDELLLRLLGAALSVRVFDTQNERSVAVAATSNQPVEQCCSRRTDVD
jgi:hypothetical protein